MKKVRSVVIVSCMVLLFSLGAGGCVQHSTDTISKGNMETTMDSMSEEKMGSDMEKPMNTLNVKEMDDSMKKDIQNDMK